MFNCLGPTLVFFVVSFYTSNNEVMFIYLFSRERATRPCALGKWKGGGAIRLQRRTDSFRTIYLAAAATRYSCRPEPTAAAAGAVSFPPHQPEGTGPQAHPRRLSSWEICRSPPGNDTWHVALKMTWSVWRKTCASIAHGPVWPQRAPDAAGTQGKRSKRSYTWGSSSEAPHRSAAFLECVIIPHPISGCLQFKDAATINAYFE